MKSLFKAKAGMWIPFTALLMFSGCVKDETVIVDPGPSDKAGVYICNEGPFMSGTGSISLFDRQSGQVSNSIYEQINNKPLGNIVQSMEVANGKGFIVVNNANKIEVINMSTLQWEATISNLTLPRFLCTVDERRAYVSCWDNTIAVINMLTLSVDKHITVSTGPERLLKFGDRVFVLNQGGFSVDSTISVINVTNDKVISQLQVYPKPSGIVTDKEGKIWVMCSGNGYNGWPASGDTEGHLLQIDPQTLIILEDYPFPDNANHPEKLVINTEGDKLYYLYKNSICEFGINDTSLKTQGLMRHNGYLYALGLDPVSGLIYTSDPVDYVQSGWIFRYQPSTGMVVDSFAAGVIPSYFCFH